MEVSEPKERPASDVSAASGSKNGAQAEDVTPGSKPAIESTVTGSQGPETTPKKPGLGAKLGGFFKGNIPVFLMMAKGALPSTIILAIYQTDAVATLLGSLGYLSAIISILSLAILPRAKFFNNIWIACIIVALSAALGLLIIYSCVQARLSTSAPLVIPASSTGSGAAQTQSLLNVPYNSSASAVAAVWLFFAMFLSAYVRVSAPPGLTGVMIPSILLLVICSNAPLIPTMSIGISFIESLLKAVYIGLGVGTAVSLIIVPVSVRTLVVKQFGGLLMAMKGALEAYRGLIHALGAEETLAEALVSGADTSASVKAVTGAMSNLAAVNSKFQVDLPFAKREIGLGKFDGQELKEMNRLTRFVYIPILGLGSVGDILGHFSKSRGWTPGMKLGDKEQAQRDESIKQWVINMRLVREPVDTMIDVLGEAIDHVMIQLGLKPRPKASGDVEGGSSGEAPGEPGFAARLQRVAAQFYSSKHLTLIEWAKFRGVDLPEDFFTKPQETPPIVVDYIKNQTLEQHSANQRQLYMLLYMEYLLYATSKGLLEFVKYSDNLYNSGRLKRDRLIIPELRQIRKLMLQVFSKDDLANSDTGELRDVNEGSHQVNMGASYGKKRDPEHLPPTNAWEKAGEGVRKIGTFFKSSNAAFAFRVAVATMSVAIPLFLKQTYLWSAQYRVYWAAIMTAISMTPTSGQSVLGFALRILGTVFAMLLAWVIYYVAGNGVTAGILVLFWFVNACLYWFLIKTPQFTPVAIITIVTITLIIGYELEGRKIGEAALGASGGTYLGILVFGPVRLATVAAGLVVAFVWTIFPYPISEHSILRRDLGGSLYLLTNFYSIVHETVAARVRRDEGDPNDKNSPGRTLEKARLKVFLKQQLVITSLKQYLQFSKFELPVGGRFPREKYEIIIRCIEKITNYMALISFASTTFSEPDDMVDAIGGESGAGTSAWSADFRRLLGQISPTSHETVMLLTLLSSAILDGQPLPPYMPSPAPYALSQRLEKLDASILSVKHVNEKGYAAFAVLQLAARSMGSDLETLSDTIREIVGTMDFGWHEVDPEKDRLLEDADEDAAGAADQAARDAVGDTRNRW